VQRTERGHVGESLYYSREYSQRRWCLSRGVISGGKILVRIISSGKFEWSKSLLG